MSAHPVDGSNSFSAMSVATVSSSGIRTSVYLNVLSSSTPPFLVVAGFCHVIFIPSGTKLSTIPSTGLGTSKPVNTETLAERPFSPAMRQGTTT